MTRAALTALGVSSLEGRRAVIPLLDGCGQDSTIHIDGIDRPVADLDDAPMTATLDTSRFPIGTRQVTLDCGAGPSTSFELLIYRQTGNPRSIALQVVQVASVGGGSFAVFWLPAVLRPRRRDQPPPRLPQLH